MKHPTVLASLALIILMLILQQFQTELLFQRERINDGEYWRILTGNFVHTNHYHWLFNAVGVFVLALLFTSYLNPMQSIISLLWLSLCVGLGLYVFNPNLVWYAGLSGALYGCYIIASTIAIRAKDNWLGLPVLIIMGGKVIWDQFNDSATQISESLIQAPVATDAHLYGAIGAIIYIIVGYVITRNTIKT